MLQIQEKKEGDQSHNLLDAYNPSLTKTTGTLYDTSSEGAAAINNYAIFAGGIKLDYDSKKQYSTESTTVKAVNSSLTPQTLQALTKAGKCKGYTTPNYAIFSTKDMYNSSLTQSQTSITPKGVAVGNYLISSTSVIDITTFTTVASCPGTRWNYTEYIDTISNARAGNYSVYAGGAYDTGEEWLYTKYVDAFNSSGTRTTADNLNLARSNIACTTLGEFAIFSKGIAYYSTNNVTDIYSASLVHTTLQYVSSLEVAAASYGNYAIFAGGVMGSIYPLKTAKAFQLS